MSFQNLLAFHLSFNKHRVAVYFSKFFNLHFLFWRYFLTLSWISIGGSYYKIV